MEWVGALAAPTALLAANARPLEAPPVAADPKGTDGPPGMIDEDGVRPLTEAPEMETGPMEVEGAPRASFPPPPPPRNLAPPEGFSASLKLISGHILKRGLE